MRNKAFIASAFVGALLFGGFSFSNDAFAVPTTLYQNDVVMVSINTDTN